LCDERSTGPPGEQATFATLSPGGRRNFLSNQINGIHELPMGHDAAVISNVRRELPPKAQAGLVCALDVG
jgi:hypothetical protein